MPDAASMVAGLLLATWLLFGLLLFMTLMFADMWRAADKRERAVRSAYEIVIYGLLNPNAGEEATAMRRLRNSRRHRFGFMKDAPGSFRTQACSVE